MKKIFVIFLIFVTISAKDIPIIEFNKDTQFDKDNYQFNVEYTGENTGLLIYVNQENKASSVSLECEDEKDHLHPQMVLLLVQEEV